MARVKLELIDSPREEYEKWRDWCRGEWRRRYRLARDALSRGLDCFLRGDREGSLKAVKEFYTLIEPIGREACWALGCKFGVWRARPREFRIVVLRECEENPPVMAATRLADCTVFFFAYGLLRAVKEMTKETGHRRGIAWGVYRGLQAAAHEWCHQYSFWTVYSVDEKAAMRLLKDLYLLYELHAYGAEEIVKEWAKTGFKVLRRTRTVKSWLKTWKDLSFTGQLPT